MLLLWLMAWAQAGLKPAKPEEFWPTSLVGYFNLIAVAISILGSGIVYFKAKGRAEQTNEDTIEKLNGLGGRVTEVEREQERLRGEHSQIVRTLDRISNSQEALLEKIADARKAAESCDDRTDQFAREIGAHVAEVLKVVNEEGRKTGERLKAVETQLEFLRKQ